MLSQTVDVPSATTAPSSSFSGPLEHYNSLIRDGQLREDLQQRAALEKLDQMQKDLRGYSSKRSVLFSKVSCIKLCGLKQPKNILQILTNSDSFYLCNSCSPRENHRKVILYVEMLVSSVASCCGSASVRLCCLVIETNCSVLCLSMLIFSFFSFSQAQEKHVL